MWQHDAELARMRTQDVERELRAAAFERAVLDAVTDTDRRRHNRVREASAASVRSLGRAVIALANRIDACAAQADAQTGREIAFH